MKKCFVVLSILLAMGSAVSAAVKGVPLQLAEKGKARAEIVVPADADVTLKFAAEELQLWIKNISGAELPLVNAEKAGVNQIVLDPTSSRYPADAEKLKGNDGYSVRSAAGKVYLNASCPKGVLNGVFRMLYKNSDIIWSRPNKRKGIFYSVNPDFSLTKTDYIDIPKFLLRGWQFNGSKTDDIDNLWQMRNGCNWDFFKPEDPTKRKYSSVMEYGGGHNIIQVYMPLKKYLKSNPDFYPMVNGKRINPAGYRLSQLCFSNEKMNETFLQEVVTRVDANPQFVTYRILMEDTYLSCECPNCIKPLKLEDGSVVEYSDPAFRSTQFFIFLNRIARHFKQHYPGKRIMTYAYYLTVIPPKCMVEDNIDVVFCPIHKNSKFAIDAPECKETEDNYLGWCKVSSNITWRDYYGLCFDFPRPMDTVAFADYRYVANHGTKRTYTEMRRDGAAHLCLTPTWNCNAVYFWTMTQACWDPFQDLPTLRKEFFSRVYGAAANDVAEYYGLIEKAWYSKFGDSRWNDSAYNYWIKYVLDTGIEDACRAALKRAASRKLSAIRRELVADLQDNFEKNIAYAKERNIIIPRVSGKVPFDPAFKAAPWKDTKVISTFCIGEGMKKDPEPAKVRLLGDKKNLYIGIEAHVGAKRLKNFFADSKKTKLRFPYRECFDIIIHGKWNNRIDYARFFVDPFGNVYSRGRAVGVRVKTKVGKSSWSAMVTVPWEEFALDPDKDDTFKMQIVRHRFSSGVKTLLFRPKDYSVMFGGGYDKKGFFSECKIGK